MRDACGLVNVQDPYLCSCSATALEFIISFAVPLIPRVFLSFYQVLSSASMRTMLKYLLAQASLALFLETQASVFSHSHKWSTHRQADNSRDCSNDPNGSLMLTSGSNLYTLTVPLDGKYHSTLGPAEDRWCDGPFPFAPQCQPCTFPIGTIQNNYGVSCTLNLSSSPAYSPKIQPQAHYRVRPIAELYGVTCEAPPDDFGSEKPISNLRLIHRAPTSNLLDPRSVSCAAASSTGQTVKFTSLGSSTSGGTVYWLNLDGTGFQDLIKGKIGCSGPKGCVSCSSFKVGSVSLTNPNGPQYCRLYSPNEASAYSVYTYVRLGQSAPTTEWGPVNGIDCQDTPFTL